MNGEIVSVETTDGVGLDGILMNPKSEASKLPVDIVIMHHGVGGKFYHHAVFDAMSDYLVANGCAALCVNNRGHHVVFGAQVKGESRLLGAAYEVVDESRYDLDAWITFAAAQGYRRIGLWGHSLGAVKTIYYLANQPDARVVCAVASSPPRQNFENYLAQPAEERALFDREYGLAKQAMDEGEPERLIATTYRRRTLFTARTYVDKYGMASRYDIFGLLPRVTIPMLVTWGGLEPLPGGSSHVSFGELPVAATKLAAENPLLRFVEIPGADHYYTDRSAQLWAEAQPWYEGLNT
jgi:pimeloyl-ACP methyl ester carboxylesterase